MVGWSRPGAGRRLCGLLAVLTAMGSCNMGPPQEIAWDLSEHATVDDVGWECYPSVGDLLILEKRLIDLALTLPGDRAIRGVFRYISVDRHEELIRSMRLETPKMTAEEACRWLEARPELGLTASALARVEAWCEDAATKAPDAPTLDTGVVSPGSVEIFVEVDRSLDLKGERNWLVFITLSWEEALERLLGDSPEAGQP